MWFVEIIIEKRHEKFEFTYKETMSEATRRRRVTYSQLEILWEFLNSHRDIAVGYNKSAHARETSRRMWEEVAQALNSLGDGAVKTGKGWSVYWTDYKGKLKKRCAAITSSQNRTGGGPSEVSPLSNLEEKFKQILGDNYGSGLPGIRVDHFNDSSTNTPSTSDVIPTLQEDPQYLDLEFLDDELLIEDTTPRVVQEGSEPSIVLSDVTPSPSFVASAPVPVGHSVAVATVVSAPVALETPVLVAPVAPVAPAPEGRFAPAAPIAPGPVAAQVAPGIVGAPVAPAEPGQQHQRQRRRRTRFTQEEARRALVESTRMHAEAAARNSQTLMQLGQDIHQIRLVLELIARRMHPDAP